MPLQFLAILESGASKLFEKVPGILRVIVVVQDRRSGRTVADPRAPGPSRGLALSPV